MKNIGILKTGFLGILHALLIMMAAFCGLILFIILDSLFFAFSKLFIIAALSATTMVLCIYWAVKINRYVE